MIKKLKAFMTSISAVALVAIPLVAPVAVYAQDAAPNPETSVCSGAQNLRFTGAPGNCTETGQAQTRVNQIVGTVINIFSVVVGIVAVIMIIFGGFRYITSGGDSGNVSSAKNTIVFAVVGLVIVALAQIIVRFVLARATGNAGEV